MGSRMNAAVPPFLSLRLPRIPVVRLAACFLFSLSLVGDLSLASAAAADRPLRVLILSGQNNHDWATTTPKLQSILAGTGRFEIAITKHPEQADASTFQGYDVLLSNWNNLGKDGKRDWPPQLREAFLTFVSEGRGLVVVHAGGWSFLDWEEYQKLTGGTWGAKTGHGPVHRFNVKIVEPEHPITRGLPNFMTTDELWHRGDFRPQKTVLATAFSAPEHGGSGENEPVAFVTQFGRGRCFNLVLGHDAAAMDSAGFKALLSRGTEWAATGKVTLPAPSTEAADLDRLLDEAASYQSTGSRATLREIEQVLAAAASQPDLRHALAAKLSARLTSPATVDARRFFCWQLSLIGSDKEVPAIAAVLTDTNLSYYARLALERIPGETSLAALQQALVTTSGREQVGVIDSLAVRGHERVVPDVAVIAGGKDADAAAAAIVALGKIGTEKALRALTNLEPGIPANLKLKLQQAELQSADLLCTVGKGSEAFAVLERLTSSGEPSALRAAAFRLHATALGQEGAPRILTALAGNDPVLCDAAIQALNASQDPALLASAAQRLGNLPSETKVKLLAMLADKHTTNTLHQIVPLVANQDANVQIAAIGALGVLGDASTVGALTPVLAAATPAERAAISGALARMPGSGVEAALISALEGGAPEVQIAVIKALRARASKQAIPAFTKATAADSAELRREAIGALGQLADASSIPALLGLLNRAAPQDVPLIESALAEICRRLGDITPLVGALKDAPAAKQIALLNASAMVGGSQALAAIQGQLQSPDPEVRLAALRLLSDWPDAAPLDSVAAVALTSTDARSKLLALRGLAKLAPQAKDRPAAQVVELLSRALLGADPNEQRALLAALGVIADPASLKVAAAQLDNPALAKEARVTVFKLLDALSQTNRAEARPVIEKLKAAGADPAETAHLEVLALKFGDLQNLSLAATATNVDGLKPDFDGGPPSAAIDGDEKTYWDEDDNQKLYVLRVDLKQLSRVAFLRIVGFQHHSYAPRDFEVLGDGKLITKVEGAQYENNSFRVMLPATVCRNVELRITGYYGASPAIRELEIYGKPADR
jgi:uncharacterized protein